jgi:uncharacterized repeat protein (TIGR01451 family)
VAEPANQAVVKKVTRTLTIEFGSDRYEINPRYNNELKDIANIMNSTETSAALIEGHTDSTGRLNKNVTLSKQRAESVKRSLIAFGVRPIKISTVIYGPARPVSPNVTPKGRQKNRRAVTIVTLTESTINLPTEQRRLLQNKPATEAPSEKGSGKIKTEKKVQSLTKPSVPATPAIVGALTITEQKQMSLSTPDTESRKQERLQIEKADKENMNVAIEFPKGEVVVPVGGNGNFPVVITNNGKSIEKFVVAMAAGKGFNAVLLRDGGSDDNITRLQLAAGETFKGNVIFKMPENTGDGDRTSIKIAVNSARFKDISFKNESVVVSSAPLMRVIAKFSNQKVVPGENLRFTVTILNAGSQPAKNISVRMKLPPQVEFRGAPDSSFKLQPNGTYFFTLDQVEIGKVANINLDVEVHKNSIDGEEMHWLVDVLNASLHQKDAFIVTGPAIQAK